MRLQRYNLNLLQCFAILYPPSSIIAFVNAFRPQLECESIGVVQTQEESARFHRRLVAVLGTDSVEAFGETAFLCKGRSLRYELAVEQVAAQV
jgi:hypothetical protein